MIDRVSPNEGENPRLIEAGEFADIVEAMTERELLEQDLRNRTMEETTGRPHPGAPLELRRRVATAKTTMLLTGWQNPGSELKFEDALDSVMGDTYAEIAKDLSEPGYTIAPEQVRGLMLNLGQTAAELVTTPGEDAATSFSKMFEAAQAIAKEEGVSVSQVYRDEKLYTGIFRKIYTLEESAAEFSKLVDGVSSEATIRTVFSHVFNTMLSVEEREQMTEQEIAEMLEEFQSDPGILAEIDQEMANARTAARQLATTQITRIWGEDSLRQLSPELRQKLGVRGRSTPTSELGNILIIGASAEQEALLRARAAFVNEFFAERGWDVNNPTPDQILAVRKQPGWQNPTTE